MSRLQTARRLFVHDMVPRKTAAHNIKAWRRMVRLLGDRWLLAQPINKEA